MFFLEILGKLGSPRRKTIEEAVFLGNSVEK